HASPPSPTLSLHDALPICIGRQQVREVEGPVLQVKDTGRRLFQADLTEDDSTVEDRRQFEVHVQLAERGEHVAVGLSEHEAAQRDRKSTRLNSSHQIISYA